MNNDNEKYIISSVVTALRVLEAITEFNDGFTITDISKKIGISRSKTYRYIVTLKQSGYITKSNFQKKYNCKYRIGFSAHETGFKLVSSMKLYTKARPILTELASETNETAYLAIEKDEEVLFLDKVDTTQKVNTTDFTGVQLPLKDNAAGMVILANRTPDHAASKSLLTIKEQGYSLDKDVLGRDVSSFAAPIFNENGIAVASVCVVAPSYRLGPVDLAAKGLPSRVRIAAERISYGIGYRSHHFIAQYKPITPHPRLCGLGQVGL